MQDHKIDDLMSTYSDNLGHFTGTVPIIKRKSIKIWKPILVTGTAFVAVGTFLLLPKSAEAAPLEKIVAALRSTKYWKSVVKVRQKNSTKWDISQEIVYFDGKLKSTSGFPPSFRLTTIIDGTKDYDDFKKLPYILKSKTGPWFKQTGMDDPMSHALRFYGAVKDWTRQDSGKYRGVETYEMRPKNAKPTAMVVVTVEKATNLPLLVRSSGHTTKYAFDIEQEYSYAQPTPPPIIAPDPGKPIIEPDSERKLAVQKWNTVELGLEKPVLLDSYLGKNGSVWVIFAYKSFNLPCWAPKSIQNGYREGTMFAMSSYGKGADYYVHSHEIVAYYFVPTTSLIGRPTSLNIEFELKPMFGGGKPATKTTMVQCDLKPAEWTFPRVFAAFAGQVPVEFLDDRFYNLRGHAKMDRKEYATAAADFEAEVKIMHENHYFANTDFSNPLGAAADCYEKMGNIAKAKELRKKIPTGKRVQY